MIKQDAPSGRALGPAASVLLIEDSPTDYFGCWGADALDKSDSANS